MRYLKRHFFLGCAVSLLAGWLCVSTVHGEETKAIAPKADAVKPAPTDAMGPSRFSFHLKPKSFQKTPELNMTVITEFTPEGRTRPPVSPDEPVYYGLHSLGQQTFGEGDAGKLVLPADKLKGMMIAALAKNGFLTAKTPEHPPTLALVYQWGLHAKLHNDQYSDPEIALLLEKARDGFQLPAGQTNNLHFGPALADDVEYELEHSPELRLEWLITNYAERANLIERAALVGGVQFASDLKEVLERSREVTQKVRDDYHNYFPEVSVYPLHILLATNPKVTQLFDQAAYDVYFVTVVAYDFEAYVRGERHALWGTKMTVNTEGVAMQESLPPLIADAAPYFGREMKEAATLIQTIDRDANVKIGPLKVMSPESEKPAEETKK